MMARIISSLSVVIFGLGLVVNLTPPLQDGPDQWSEPINLSQSGAASNPSVVVDANEVVHVVWQDEVSGMMYSNLSDGVWSEPETVLFPFSDSKPKLISDDNGFIHAFWVQRTGPLLYSRVMADRFNNIDFWIAPQTLAISAVNFDVTLDSQGFLHIGYIRDIDADGVPAGIFYKKSTDSGNNWSSPISIFPSLYFRSLPLESTNIGITDSRVEDFTNILIYWDLQPRGQSFVAQSVDGGENWDAPVEIGELVTGIPNGHPGNVKAYSIRNEILLLWQDVTGCIQSYVHSTNTGETWSIPQEMLENLRDCGFDNIFIGAVDGYPLLQTISQNQIYLSVWNGSIWSEPFPQNDLIRFADPLTSETIAIDDQQMKFINDNQLIMVGVDTSEYGDVWVRIRGLPETKNWFPLEGVWSTPDIIQSRESEIHSLVAVSGEKEILHLFWSESEATQGSISEKGVINYSVLDGDDWSAPVVVASSSASNAIEPHVILDSAGRLLLVWTSPMSGDVFFSWANENLALIPSEWAEPVVLPTPGYVSGSADITIDDSGMIFVTYAISLNEMRGVYLTSSDDLGSTWSEPVKIFDGTQNDWQMIDDPHIAVSESGDLTVIWTRYHFPGAGGSLGVYSSYSSDRGSTWSETTQISSDASRWNQIIYINRNILFCFWQREELGFNSTMYSVSSDQGNSWDQAQSIGSTWEEQGVVAITKDSAGKVHLIKQIPNEAEGPIISHWEWNGISWLMDDYSIKLNYENVSSINSLSIAASKEGSLRVLIQGSSALNRSGQQSQNIIFSTRNIDSTEISIPKTDQVLIPTQFVTQTATQNVTLEPTSVVIPSPPTINRQPAKISLLDNYTGVVFGLLLTVLLIAIAFGWRVYKIIGRS